MGDEEKKEDKKGGDALGDEDPRLEFIQGYLQKSWRMKPEKWLKMIGNEELKIIVMNFLDKPKTGDVLVMTMTAAGVMMPVIGFPALIRTKASYFIRRTPDPVTKDNLRTLLVIGDIAPNPVEELAVLVDEVFVPLLSNPRNHRGWPTVVVDDVKKHVHAFKNVIYQVLGKMSGQTLLPMPVGVERVHQVEQDIIESNGEKIDVHLKSGIEGVLIKWSQQINDVLREDSSMVFNNGANPVPIEEIEFWSARLKNLECIYDQLRDPRVKKMASVLELTDSAYFPTFRTLFNNVVGSLTEARDIVLYLKPLAKHFETVEGTEFVEVIPLLEPLMRTVCLVWANCRHYCNSPRIIVLLKEISNLFIQEATKLLDPGSIFQGEVDEARDRVSKCIAGLIEFRNVFEECRNTLHTFFVDENVEPVHWNFHERVVFERKKKFVARLQEIELLFATALEFLKLEKVEIGGLKGRALSGKVVGIFNDFQDKFAHFQNIQYDPLDPEDNSFVADFNEFLTQVVDMDRKLAAIFCQAFDDCNNLESIFKLIQVAGSLIERPIVAAEVDCKYKMIVDMFDEELDTCKEIYDEQLAYYSKNGYMLVDKHFPPVAGALFWMHKLRHRMAHPMSYLEDLDNPITQTEDCLYQVLKYQQMIKMLADLEKKVFDEWVKVVPGHCQINLDRTLMVREKTMEIGLNFHEQLVAALREVRYLKLLEKEGIPPDALDLYDRCEQLHEWVGNLNLTIEWYNRIRLKSNKVEFDLISDEINVIDGLIQEVLDNLTWNSETVWEYIEKIRDLVKNLQDRVLQAHANVDLMNELIVVWGSVPLFDRKGGKPENLVIFDDKQDKVNKRYAEITRAGEEIHRMLAENYDLYHNIVHTPPDSGDEDTPDEDGGEEQEGGAAEEQEEKILTPEEEEAKQAQQARRAHRAEKRQRKAEAEQKRLEEEAAQKLAEEEEAKRLAAEAAAAKKKAAAAAKSAAASTPASSKATTPAASRPGTPAAKGGKKKPPPPEPEPEPEEEVVDEMTLRIEAKREKWLKYVEYIDELVTDSLLNALAISLSLFMEEMDNSREPAPAPLFEVQLQLQDPDLCFKPSLESDDENNFYEMFEGLLHDIIHMTTLIPRVATHYEVDYLKEMQDNSDLTEMQDETLNRVRIAMKEAIEYCQRFETYSYLWLDDRQVFLQQFLLYGRQLNAEELDILDRATDDSPGLKETPPTNVQFKEQIDHYEALYKEVDTIVTEQVFTGWFKVDIKPFKHALLNTVCKWGNLFKQHLVNHVINSLKELAEFIVYADKGLLQPVAEDDYDALLRVMGVLLKVRQRQAATDEMFEPLKETIELLKLYDVEFAEEIYIQLQELPERWNNTKKIAVTVKTQVAPLMAAQVTRIRKRISLFDYRQTQYREIFRKLSLFKFDCPDVYLLLDKTNLVIAEFEDQMKKIHEQANLFDVLVPDFKQIKACRKEIKMLKQLWDYVHIVISCIDEWKTTPWKKIDVEAMDLECKKFGKEIRGLDKEMRVWDTYTSLEATIKNLLTSLRAVTELQNPAIRERHWKQLMAATQVRFAMSEETTLSDLLALNLHEYEEEVKNIVDKSVKEMSMEKVLKELNATWSTMEFESEVHARTHCTVPRASEELIEILEENQVQLQNLMGSKFIAYFLEEVSDWQKKLSNADQVIQIWFEVQRTWMHLESIFIGSEDIRNQLPEDSRRFDSIDKQFRELLSDIVRTPNVVKATNKPGLFDKLEVIQSALTLCEKALAEYLETKRLAYPRFYFVSSADLLDILSNGNQPELVAKHLIKLYDSMAKLKFTQEGGKNTKNAKGMFAKDGEYVEFSGNCDCSGKVEIWLNRLTDAMRRSCRHYFGQAVGTYDEKPREQWIFDYPAQPALCGTQIWWTTEVNIAFARLEEGYENAVKDYQKKQILQLSLLITLLLGDLSKGDRQKIMTVCTIDVHSRDVVGKLIQMRVETSAAFQWQSQLRHRWDEKVKDCFCNICDAQFRYAHEYLGNTPRLVITPLTDRCYITLTQSLHLIMGGAPAGPAGTGKTETTKDLGRAMGVMVYVFNCSEQMDYKSCGNIYKGLAQTGAWGCFDEFNRISIEVLSVVSVQVKSVLDAIKTKKTMFNFMGENIALIPTVGMFITMNPGYAGRTELPENLKALFRPCAMVVPDFELICEIMLVAEGFQEARLLARKFITLYTLCRELLSKQDHYDWGLRAIKSVLVVAGALKRGDRNRPEDQVLMRALRDFNVPKIVTDDTPIFMGLIGDLFPALDVPRKRDPDFERLCRHSAMDLKLQPEDNFILKIVQLEELFEVRHSVFIVGNAGTGKSMVWKSLFRTYQNQKRKPMYNDLNPKAVTNDELFGIINPATREWKDGLISVLMRDQANLTGDGPKWIVLDGDIDPMWIESLNTVMDDNKVLTLASNERIALTPMMRLLFEISNLRTATPATVSRAGILYINPQDLGWNPFVTSWIDTREIQSEKANLIILFDKYIPPCLDVSRGKFKKITPIPEISHVQMLCHLLDCLLTPANVPTDCPKEWYEIYFTFACVWAFGAAMFQDQLVDYRVEFTKWWTNEFKTVKFPSTGTVFNYYIDFESKRFVPWNERVQKFDLDYDIPLQSTLVDTTETTRLRYFMDLLMARRLPVMLVGAAGSGKSVIVADKLGSLNENYAIQNVPFNFYTSSEMLQKVLERPLEKKAGRNYGPPGSKLMVYFVDDMNMPEVDTYGTVQPHTLIRQYMDYGHWYDRIKMSLKDIHNCQFASCMNPTAGSFTIDPRLQRHFCVFAVSFPSSEPLFHIYNTILTQHLANPLLKFPITLAKISNNLVTAALTLHQKMGQMFLPTSVKFHYIFNLRDLSNIFQGILFAVADTLPNPDELIRLWMHEANRVYGDKLIDSTDIDNFNKLVSETVKKGFEEMNENNVFEKPLIFCHFAEGIGENKYLPVKSWETLNKLLEEGMSQYNDLVGAMNLVLFEDAMNHVCRINRILESPRGNALLVGVGGSGKQSLARLSAFISSLDVFQVQLRKGYAINDLKADLASLYLKSGLKGAGLVFLMTDSQVAEERFLVLINDMLASGEIPDLFADDEVENIVGALKSEVKGAGLADTKENCWKFFINRVRQQLKVVLCFSPVGSTLRVRSRKFPAIINCTAIDWFHEWPQSALESVSSRFLEEIEVLPEEIRHSVSLFMAYVHTVVNTMSAVYLLNEKRYNYTTPKSFLEQINLYSKLLTEKTTDLEGRIVRLENGLLKLFEAGEQVDGLKEILAVQEVELKIKNDAADQLIQVVGIETEKVSKEKAFAAEEERKVRLIEEDVSVKAHICSVDLAKAEPALIAAMEALNTLNKNNLTELKSFGTPPPAVVSVTAAVLVLFSVKGKVPKDRSWMACKVMMGKVDQFLSGLINYDKENIHPDVYKAVLPYLADKEFVPDNIRSKSLAAAGLCAWVINIIKFYDVYVVVEPKRQALKAANDQLKAAREMLSFLKEKIASLEEQLQILTDEFEVATAEKMKCQAEADATAMTIDLANRLVNGLASENIRWRESVKNFKLSGTTLPGDILLVTAFISYVGCFTRKYRIDLQKKYWLPFLKGLQPGIPLTENLDPLTLLTDDAQIATWNNEGLPSDRMSTENATIMTNSARWPLMIDPQLQGIKWIKNKYGDDLKVIRLGQRSYLDVIELSLSEGFTVLLEYIGENVDAVLDPLLGRNLIRKGRAIKIGDKEMDYNNKFRFILQTKLANPHYKPEMQAQCTLINFTVTRDGLEEQLLAEVVKAERPDLESLKSELTKQQNDFKITLKVLEDDLLYRLSTAGDNILADPTLVYNLETTKRTAAEIEVKVAEAKITSVQIDEAFEEYRPAATRASLLYFILNDLNKINRIYQFSLKAFSVVFQAAIANSIPAENIHKRVINLVDCISFSVFMYTSRGLFECDKLIFMAQMAIQILITSGEIDAVELDFLLRFPFTPYLTSPVDFLTNMGWGGIKALSGMDEFRNLDKDIEGSAKRWRKYVECETPEREKLPQEWKNKTALQRLCIMRALRPDRMTYAVRTFIEEKLGTKYTEARSVEFAKSFQEASSSTPVFFILSAGVDPLKDVEKLGKKLGYTFDKKNFHNVSLGQGQEVVAEAAMDVASEAGHWVILQNIHLVEKWLSTLEKKMELYNVGSHENYRLFVSAEPAPSAEYHIIPQGVLESSIKITNEPPTGMLANVHKSLDCFTQETLEMSTKEAEFKAILFSLCYFHAVVAERRKFGPQGWNRSYPFNQGDLTISVLVLFNYLESSARVPWEDLRYLFGEIMYGGHITDDWDRRLCRTYLQEYMQPDLVDGDLALAPGFMSPPNTDFVGYHSYLDHYLPAESPYLYGLHPNAEIGFLTTLSENLFRTVFEMQPRDSGAAGASTMSREDKVKQILDDITDKLPDLFHIAEIMAKVEERTPYIIVAFQECERMNTLIAEMKRSLKELDLGLKGELTITTEMEGLETSLFLDNVPGNWSKRAYPSMLTLGPWFADLMLRLKELETWTNDFVLPSSVWLAGFFNPQSFLTAIMQSTARKNEWPLDKMCLHCEVTKKQKEDFTSAPREGAYINGLFMEGARWDLQTGGILESRLKDLFPMMPVIFIKAITQDKQDLRNMYECPVYKTRQRGPTFVWTFNLKTKEKPNKWTLAGVAVLLQT